LNGSIKIKNVEVSVPVTTSVKKKPENVPVIATVMDKEPVRMEDVSEKLTTLMLVIQKDLTVTSSLPSDNPKDSLTTLVGISETFKTLLHKMDVDITK